MTNGRSQAGDSPIFFFDSLVEPGFTWQTALSLAYASRLSFETPRLVVSITRESWGFERTEFFDEVNTQAYLTWTPEVAVLAFRGSKGIADWLGNLRMASVADPAFEGRVHEGFLKAYRDVSGVIDATLLELRHPPRTIWITGHSLGGALAALATQNLARGGTRFETAVTITAMTYGQPRTGDADFASNFDQLVGDRFYRFVNDDDLVTRVPPGYSHFGQLVHFDATGNLTRTGSGEADSSLKPGALTQEEFEDLQRQVRFSMDALRDAGMNESEAAAASDASMEGLFPAVKDHDIDGYIAAIRRQLPGSFIDVTSSKTRRNLHLRKELASSAIEDAEWVVRAPFQMPVMIRVATDDWTPPPGVRVNSRIGSIVSALVTESGLEQLEADSEVQAVEESRDAATPELDTSVTYARGDVVQRPPLDERGDAALVGIIDEGIDVLHDALTDKQGETRIVAVWNQRDNTGPTPSRLNPGTWTPDYGTVYSAGDIAAMRSGQRPTPDSLRDQLGHGTHVASIAAGRSAGDCPTGMAPEAAILVVIPNMTTVPGAPPSIGYSSSHTDALHFLTEAAKGGNALVSVARPIAVNVSLGKNAGAHDGMTLLEAAFDMATNKGRDKGVVIVKSAGNERRHGGHARVRAALNAVVEVTWDSSGLRFEDYLEAWFDAVDDLEFVLKDPAGNVSSAVTRISTEVTCSLGGNRCDLKYKHLHPDNGDNRLSLHIMPSERPIQHGVWSLQITGLGIRSRDGWVDVWAERYGRKRSIRFDPPEPSITLSVPGTASTVVTVGACDSIDPMRLASFSSLGKTRKGLPKPDIVAPGMNIRAARSNTDDHQDTFVSSGTSQSAPHVTGALALVLSKQHKLEPAAQFNANQLRMALIVTARNKAACHHEGFGWGALDAEALIRHLFA